MVGVYGEEGMERIDWENEVEQRKKTYQEGVAQRILLSDKVRGSEEYGESRRAWKDYVEGKITADEVGERLGRFNREKPKEITMFKDIFGAKEI
jgi:hypothetical protein